MRENRFFPCFPTCSATTPPGVPSAPGTTPHPPPPPPRPSSAVHRQTIKVDTRRKSTISANYGQIIYNNNNNNYIYRALYTGVSKRTSGLSALVTNTLTNGCERRTNDVLTISYGLLKAAVRKSSVRRPFVSSQPGRWSCPRFLRTPYETPSSQGCRTNDLWTS